MTTAVARPPGPPFQLRQVLTMLRRDTPPWRFLALARQHPRLTFLSFGKQGVYLVTHPDLVRQVLVGNSRSVDKGPALRAAGTVLGNGLLTMPGSEHRPRRRLVNPAFHHTRLAGYAEVMSAATVEFEQGWRDGDTVDMAEQMSALTLAIVGRTLFGSDLGGAAGTVYADLGNALNGWEKMMLPGGDRLMRLPLPVFRRMWASAAALDDVVKGLVDRAVQARTVRAGSPGDDVVGDLLDAEIDGESLSHSDVRDEAMTLMLAGHETTANALAWTWHLLSEHPAAADRLRAEVAGLGTPAPSYADLPRLPWTLACVAEVLRLYPPAWVLEREVTEELELDGWRLPVGSIVLASQFALHRDERFWDRPAQFRPQRWLTPEGTFSEDAPGQPRGAWFPFGAGTRVCVGESFAWTETALVLALLARHWAPVTDPAWVPTVHAAVTLRPQGGLPMRLRRV